MLSFHGQNWAISCNLIVGNWYINSQHSIVFKRKIGHGIVTQQLYTVTLLVILFSYIFNNITVAIDPIWFKIRNLHFTLGYQDFNTTFSLQISFVIKYRTKVKIVSKFTFFVFSWYIFVNGYYVGK